MSDYVFKLKKGELELELASNDPAFIEAQMNNWRQTLLNDMQSSPAPQPAMAGQNYHG